MGVSFWAEGLVCSLVARCRGILLSRRERFRALKLGLGRERGRISRMGAGGR